MMFLIHHSDLCPWAWYWFKSSCYTASSYFNNEKYTWPDARQFCESWGASLFTVTSQEENAFLSAFKFQSWIGAHQQNGQWVWTDGTEMSFTNWQTKVNTKFAQGNCAMMQRYHGGKWSKRNCTTRADFLCEKGITNNRNLKIIEIVFSETGAPEDNVLQLGVLCL